ncbi:MAG: GGDEF domain-containing protein [Alphaproteobacteria bacterium]|nr:GGDEF domain-containing protein [Alphaproteobacteria bacterium]
MQIDAFTILLSGVAVKAPLCLLFFAFWLHDRRSTWFAWLSVMYFFAMLAGLSFIRRGFVGEFEAVGVAVAMMLVAAGMCWQAARAFERRKPLWLPLILMPCAWLAIAAIPGFLENMRLRIVVSSLFIAPLIALTAVEYWRGREERLMSRWPIIVLFGSYSLLFGSRLLFVDILPFPFGALPETQTTVAVFNLIAFFHTLVLTVLLVAISRERLELEQRTKAQTDPLTGALNRRAFMARGARLLQRHAYEQNPLSLLFFDLDHFKALNDRFGHSGGDDVLVRFVGVVNGNIRPTDFLFRIGGEEFCCILPGAGVEPAARVAERIRQQFEAGMVQLSGKPVTATVSVGVACTSEFGYDLDTLVRRADMAVYAAKRQGRNRVAVARADDAPAPLAPIGEPTAAVAAT